MELIASKGGKARWKKTVNEMMRGRVKYRHGYTIDRT